MQSQGDYPEEGELVVGTVREVKNFGAFVILEEYPGKEGFIHIAEIATGWVKYVRDHVRENQKVVCKVIGVDRSKGHVDLSLKKVNEHQRRESISEWKNETKAKKLLEIMAAELAIPQERAEREIGEKLLAKFGTLYRAFETAAASPEELKNEGIEGDWVEKFVKIASDNISIPFVQVKGVLELTSYAPDGVKHLKAALEKAGKSDYEDVEITLKYLGAPRYLVKVKAPDYKVAEDELRKAADRIVKEMQKHGGEAAFSREVPTEKPAA